MSGCHDSHPAIATAKLIIIADIPNCHPHIASHSPHSRTTAVHTSVVSRPECGPQRLPRQLLPHAAVGIPHDHHSTVFTIDRSPIDIITAGLYGLYVR
ncbi:hypothetical protein, partial [Muribaculum intestinale]|uniref:hypothetical protein n=1 Tax=Muribaculum intestinale TaxID=1796646 RepID=UPI0024BB167B